MAITMEEAAAALDGNQYHEEGSKELFAAMKAAGLVAVFGASDDLMEFRGAVYDEIGAYDGGKAHFTTAGLLTNDCDNDDCPHFAKLQATARAVEALWCPDDLHASWLMKTDLPHAAFKIMEEENLYCVGLVFALADCTPEHRGLAPHLGRRIWSRGLSSPTRPNRTGCASPDRTPQEMIRCEPRR